MPALALLAAAVLPPSAYSLCHSHRLNHPSTPQDEYELNAASGSGAASVAANAARHWRSRRAATGRGAFAGLRVLVAPQLDPPFRREDVV